MMIIKKSVLDRIFLAIRTSQFESGGILGAVDEVITDVTLDKGNANCHCAYEPDIDLLNHTIGKWQSQGIIFVGLFHTHFFGVLSLSSDDIAYIERILFSMPDEIHSLYFPIVLPEYSKMIPYKAVRIMDRVEIYEDDLTIMQ